MTDFSFRIRFPHAGDSPGPIVFKPGVHVIYGESGVGKSELCRRLVSFRSSPSPTRFMVGNVTPVDRPMMVLQDPDDQIVAPTVYRELAFNLENLGWNPSRIEQRMEEMINLVGVTRNLNRHPSSLSGGERQILNLATALSVWPDLLVIDDGLAFLSESNKKRVTGILESYCDEMGAVIVWATSELPDLRYGIDGWELRADSLVRRPFSGSPASVNGSVPPGKAHLKINDLTFRYEGTDRYLFRNQNVTVGPFRSLAVLGDNGSGKTTLGRLLSGIVHPGEGRIRLELDGQEGAKLGLLPQFPERLFGGRTVMELLAELKEHGLFPGGATTIFQRSLREFGISEAETERRTIHSLSVSDIRVAITFMICLATYDVVVLDEPLFGLGIAQRSRMLEYLRRFLSQKHLILITHSPSVAREVCDTAITITDGDIEEISLPKRTDS